MQETFQFRISKCRSGILFPAPYPTNAVAMSSQGRDSCSTVPSQGQVRTDATQRESQGRDSSSSFPSQGEERTGPTQLENSWHSWPSPFGFGFEHPSSGALRTVWTLGIGPSMTQLDPFLYYNPARRTPRTGRMTRQVTVLSLQTRATRLAPLLLLLCSP